MKTRLSFILFSLVAVLLFQVTAKATEQISVSLNGSNNYTIPPSQSTNNIRFDVSATGLTNGNLYYGWSWRIDGGSWSTPTDIGFGGGAGTYSGWVAMYLGEGTHTLDVHLLYYENPLWVIIDTDSENATLTKQFSITVQNSFGSGNVKVNSSTYSSGADFTFNNGSSQTLEAIDEQNDGTYEQHFDEWDGPSVSTPQNLSTNITVGGNDTYTANFLKESNISFQNSLPGTGSGGIIKVNSTQYNSPASNFTVIETGTITGQGVYQVINRIEYTFDEWDDEVTTNPRVFTPEDHDGYTASYNAKPLPPADVSAGGSVGNAIQITWTEHPHTSVSQYQVWRKAKPLGGQEGSPELLTTVNRGTTSYQDNEYAVTSTYTDYLLSYDVRAYFSVNGTYSDPNYVTVYGEPFAKTADGSQSISMVTEELPTEFAISNYPNPFNPSTTISYSLPEPSHVSLKVFDMLGKEVAVLVDSEKAAGRYQATFDAAGLPSGTYIYRIDAGKFSQTKRIVLLK